MTSDGGVGKKIYWIADSEATCHMGTSLKGCTGIVYVNDKVIVGNGRKSVCKAHATFNGVAILRNGKERKITIKNFVYFSELKEYLFRITYALQNYSHFMDEDKILVLFKNKVKIKFDRVVKKGSSFVMCLNINPCFLDQVKIGTKELVEKKKAKEKKAVDFIERLVHPSEELKIATANSKGIELKSKEGAK